VAGPDSPTFVAVDERRRAALLRAVAASTATWTDRDRTTVAALLDMLWNLPSYERLVGVWNLTPDDATRAVTWLIEHVVAAVDADEPLATA
jgi:hypothetical protein